jgi:hypothetical protein
MSAQHAKNNLCPMRCCVVQNLLQKGQIFLIHREKNGADSGQREIVFGKQ